MGRKWGLIINNQVRLINQVHSKTGLYSINYCNPGPFMNYYNNRELDYTDVII